MPTTPAGYRFYTPMQIRYGDMDTLGHVNNAKYLTYIEQARIQYVDTMQLWDGGPHERGLIVAKITCEYKLPLKMADGTAHIYTRVARIGTKSFDVQSTILREDGAEAAAALVVIVAYNYVTNQSIPVPDDWRAVITEYEPAL
jgi:acyl-CoA thioester hydrolase